MLKVVSFTLDNETLSGPTLGSFQWNANTHN